MIPLDDLRLGFRHLARHPGASLFAVLAIAIGIGGTTAIFTLFRSVVLAPPAYADADRLWVPYLTSTGAFAADRPQFPFSYPKFETFRAAQKVFDGMAAYMDETFNRTGSDEPERISVELVTPEYFSVLGARPRLGRLFAVGSEDRAGGEAAALLSHAYWSDRFGGDPGVLGQVVEVEHQSFRVVGVLEPTFAALSGRIDVWLPLAQLPRLWQWNEALEVAGNHFLLAIARARSGLDRSTIAAGARDAGLATARAHPESSERASDVVWGAGTTSLAANQRDPNLRRSLLVLLAAVVGVLLVACANVAGLQLARATLRRREMAVRASLGAARSRLLAQGFAESLGQALVGGLAGVALAVFMVRGLLALAPQTLGSWGLAGADLDRLVAAEIDLRVLAVALAATLASSLLAGLAPAWSAARTDPGSAMREGGASVAGAAGHARHGLRRLLVVAQTAASIVLLVGAGLLLRSLAGLLAIDPGFDARSVLTAQIVPSQGDYNRETAPEFHRQLLEAVNALPGVTSASLGTCRPLSDNCNGTVVRSLDGVEIEREANLLVGAHNVGPAYFRSLGIRLRAGREFANADRMGAPRVAILSRSAAAKLFPGTDPLGHRLSIGMGMRRDEQAAIVGVVDDVHYETLTSPPRDDVYLADLQSGWSSATLFVRTGTEPLELLPALRETLRRIAPDLPLVGVRTMREQVARASSRTRFAALLLALFAGVALLLAALGVYGLVAQTVADRRRELGLRMALGANRARLGQLVLGQGLLLAAAGVTLGIPLAWLAGRVLESLLYQVSSSDFATLAGVALLVLASAGLACWLPAWRASRLDPATTLRQN